MRSGSLSQRASMAGGERVARLMRQLAGVACPAHSQAYSHSYKHGEVQISERKTDYAFEMACSNIRFGEGVTREIGMVLSFLIHPQTFS
ncbi:hypothetical protein DNTS_024322 [Danionella cerebrum]|uniref:Uncharacterized protein n=1 Tax=Danionella cerebrum TaxID=2873325 RepID=A0A553NLM6_9TELE|nr:hypothetical protein DNTS_024322 [Danionella translucida]